MMKTNAKRKNSAVKKLIPAAGMLALSASMLATSTYAWFTMNREVQVYGLAMKTKVGSNLLISSDNVEAHYLADTLSEGRKALLEPVSSVTGKTGEFFYSLDATASGSKAHTAASGSYEFIPYNETTSLANTIAGKNSYDTQFNEKYGITTKGSAEAYQTAYGYVDYIFYLKATGDSADQQLRMTQCDLNYNNTNVGTGDKAWRVAVFASDVTANGGKGNTGEGASVGTTDPATGTAKSILKFSDAGNFTSEGKGAVASALTYGDASYNTAAVIDADIDAGVTRYYKMLVRVWLEGEDTTCNSQTYAALQNEWSLDLDFKLVDKNAADNSTASPPVSGVNAVTGISNNAFVPTTTATQTAVTSPIEVVTAGS